MITVLNAHMTSRRYVMGDKVSAADFVMAHTLDWANEVGLLAGTPRLEGYIERMFERAKAPPRIAQALEDIARQ